MPLAVVPTPIGNLEDITLRALRYLREADLVACEDTRRTGRLLAHYEIKKDLVALHEHNEDRLAGELAERAQTLRVALVSDAGMPLVSDPGYRLVAACIEGGVGVGPWPGPSAPVTALVLSGLPADAVVFLGFPPRKGRDRSELLARVARESSTFALFQSAPRPAGRRTGRGRSELRARVARESSTFVLFESPHRLAKTLGDLLSGAPVAVCRELTKLHEGGFRGGAAGAGGAF